MEFQHINQLCDIVRETSFAIHRCSSISAPLFSPLKSI
jgi:hypothetical protein